MAMTRKDYELVALSLANQRANIAAQSLIEIKVLDKTIETLAATFALVHDNFKKDVFMEKAHHGQDSNAGL